MAKRKGQRSRSRSVLKPPKGGAVAIFAFIIILGGFSLNGSDSIDHDSAQASVEPTCADMEDNDGDGLTDLNDPECDPENPLYDGEEDGDN